MNYNKEFFLMKSIVQSGQSTEEWDSLRQGNGVWSVEKEAWKQFRIYSIEELKDKMKLYETIIGKQKSSYLFKKIVYCYCSLNIFLIFCRQQS